MIKILRLTLFCFLNYSLSYGEEKLIFAAIVYRHGDRTPISPYPTDPWRNESLWPVKFGELTNIGKRQHYAYGKWLRNRYSHLVSDQFDADEVYVRSTDVDRTLMSAQANLAGMYPPVAKSVWDENIMWQPIPVHTVPQKDDNILAMSKSCMAYDRLKQKYLHSKEYREGLSKYNSLMNYLSVYTGLKVTNYKEIEYIYGNLFIESLYNFTLPDWTKTVYPDKMKEAACYSFKVPTANPMLAKLRVSPFLQLVTSEMTIASNSSQCAKKYRKLLMFSAHDDTVGDILNALNVFDGNCPPYTATIFIELLRDSTTLAHYVRISYRNTTDITEPHVLSIPYCGKKCPINRYLKLYSGFLALDWEKECKKMNEPIPVSLVLYYGVGIIVLIYGLHMLAMWRVKRWGREVTLINERQAFQKLHHDMSTDNVDSTSV